MVRSLGHSRSTGILGELSQIATNACTGGRIPGSFISSMHKELQLPKAKVDQIKSEAGQVLNQGEASARQLAQLIGKLSAAILAVYPAPLHYRSLQALKHKALASMGYKGAIKLLPKAEEDLRWWVNNLSQWNGRKVSQPFPV